MGNIVKGRVAATPYIMTTSTQNRSGVLEVTTSEHGLVRCFFNDPEDEKLHSFRRDDEVEIEVVKSGKFWNGKTVVTPRGSVPPEEMDDVINRALDVEEGILKIDGFDDRAQELIGIYSYARRLVLGNGDLMESIRNVTSDGNRIEETVHAVATTVVIQVNKEGIRFDELAGAINVSEGSAE